MSNNNKLSFKNITFIFSDDIAKDKDESFYERFFDRASILKSNDVSSCDGRGKTLLFKLDNKDLILRHYNRGGLFGKLVKDRFFLFESNAHRAIDEFNLLNYMVSQGLKVPRPVIAREQRNLMSVSQDIVIERLVGFSDLSKVISKRHLTKAEFIEIGKTIKQFFDKDIHHTDLNIRNILIDDKCNVYVIDFDKCFNTKLNTDLKLSMLSRLLRSFNKEVNKSDKNAVYFNESDFEFLKQEALKN